MMVMVMVMVMMMTMLMMMVMMKVSRDPGLCSPLMCLAGADLTRYRESDLSRVTRKLAMSMTSTAFGQKNTKGNNVIHLVASRGHLGMMQELLPIMKANMTKDEFHKVAHQKNDKGKACLDVAVYNREVKLYMKTMGIEHVAPPDPGWQQRLPSDHHWQRGRYR